LRAIVGAVVQHLGKLAERQFYLGARRRECPNFARWRAFLMNDTRVCFRKFYATADELCRTLGFTLGQFGDYAPDLVYTGTMRQERLRRVFEQRDKFF